MARSASYYPASPEDIPEDLTTPSTHYQFQVVLVLFCLLLFFMLYMALIGGLIAGMIWALLAPTRDFVLRFVMAGILAVPLLFLIKGFFKRHQVEKEVMVEITEEEHPRLFGFIEKLCDETGAPFPSKVYVSHEVNACVFYDTSPLHLILPTPKNLLIGLGLVNMLNLSEFKAVLGHEFGHFAQSSMKLHRYVYVANRIIADLVFGRDWFDDVLQRMTCWGRLAIFAYVIIGILWVFRKILEGFYYAINFFSLALSRQMEFNADLVAVSVAGSDAPVHALARLGFASASLGQAMHDLRTAADHKLYTSDVFYHQNHSAKFLRLLAKDPNLGEPPPIPEDPMLTVEVFDPDDDEGPPPMWSTHPPNYDREQNIKEHYVRSVMDERSPWILFDDQAELREKVTWKFYRVVARLKKDVVLADPEAVQGFIDDEHAETTYNTKYSGLYDQRFLEPGDVGELTEMVRKQPWTPVMLARGFAKLYSEELKEWMEDHNQRREEYDLLYGLKSGELALKKTSFKFRGKRYGMRDVKRLLKKVDKELEEDREWLASLDRRVFLIHYQMARQQGDRSARELANRYRFHLDVQEILRELNIRIATVDSTLEYLSNNNGKLEPEEYQGLLEVFREAHRSLSRSLKKARDLEMPELKNMDKGQTLNRFLLEKKLVYELDTDEESIQGKWVGKFMEQIHEVRDKARRIHFKSLGGILTLQEEIARKWSSRIESAPEVVAVADPAPKDT